MSLLLVHVTSMSANLLEVLIKNTSPELHYEGEWVSAPPVSYITTLSDQLFTVPNGRKGLFSYDFTGVRQLLVQGFLQGRSKFGEDYKIECHISTRDPGVMVFVLPGLSNWSIELVTLCSLQNLLPAKNYTLTVTIESLRGSIIWVDALRLDPVPTTNTNNALVIVNHYHSMLQYDSHWVTESYDNVAHGTDIPGSVMKLDFNGTSLKWYTKWNELLENPSNITSTSSWSVNNSPPQTFTNPIPGSTDVGHYRHHLVFEILDLSPGLHRLVVTHHGAKASQPLSLSSLVIQNCLDGPDSSSTPVGDGHTFTLPSQDHSVKGLPKRTKIYIAVGSTMTAVILCGCCAALLLAWYRRRRTAARRKEDINNTAGSGEPTTSPDSDAPALSVALSASSDFHPPMSSFGSKGTPVMQPISSLYPHDPISDQPKSAPILTLQWKIEDSLPPPYRADPALQTLPTASGQPPI